MESRHVQRSPSQTPPPDLEAAEQEKFEQGRGFRDILVNAHGRPCYPIELAPKVFRNPGPYKDVVSYWDNGPPLYSLPIGAQLQRWNEFHRFQQRNRDYFRPRNRFPEFSVESLTVGGCMNSTAMYEIFEKNLEKAKAALIVRRKAVADAGLTAHEDISAFDFGGILRLNLAHGGDQGPALTELMQARRKLELAESRLKAARSDDLGDIVERGAWVRWFQEQIDAAQAQLDAVPKYRKEDWLSEGKYYVQEGKDEWERTEKTRAALIQRHRAESKAEDLLTLAREGLRAARADGFGEEVARAALVDMVSVEV